MISSFYRLRQSISRRNSFSISRFFQYVIPAVMILVCAVSDAAANGNDVGVFLKDFEQQRRGVKACTARFVQNKTIAVFDENKISTGAVLYKAPRQMLWQYEEPDKTQMRMDGETVSFYFPELEQIEIYEMDESRGAAHFFLAFEASADELNDNFEITLEDSGDERLKKVRLIPKTEPISS
jgi:outer membrane lipoprotein-sorting protein